MAANLVLRIAAIARRDDGAAWLDRPAGPGASERGTIRPMPVHARTAVRDRALRIPPFRLNTYIEGIQQGWPEHDIERVIVRGLPRHFHAQSRQTQTARLGERVPLTHTKWDALLAAMVEHLAQLHDHPVPAWVNEPERFLDPPWIVATNRWTRLNSLMFSPPAFLRHGAIPDPRDLDGRGGEHDAWAP